MPDNGKAFVGSIPDIYDDYLVPLIFEPYADDLARRVVAKPVEKSWRRRLAVGF